MPLPALKAANELLKLHGDVDHMKLQKLLYYANGWWLATEGTPLLNEPPEVWRYGPVFAWLYSSLNRFGHSNIGGPVAPGPFAIANQAEVDVPQDRLKRLLEWIWNEHGHKSAIQLSDETHAVGTPWRQIAEKHNFRIPANTPIPAKLDWEYFTKLARTRGIATQPLRA
jgi:uncharacterized phage-associated protein